MVYQLECGHLWSAAIARIGKKPAGMRRKLFTTSLANSKSICNHSVKPRSPGDLRRIGRGLLESERIVATKVRSAVSFPNKSFSLDGRWSRHKVGRMSSDPGGDSHGSHDALHTEWVARIQRGDPAAFEALYRMYVGELVQFVAGIVRSFEDAQDVVEEVFVALWMRRVEWAPRYGARAYLFAAARNRALNERRNEATALRLGEAAGQVFGEGDDEVLGMGAPLRPVDETLDAEAIAAAVERALAGLPEMRRAVLELRLRQGMSGNEVAEVLGISRNAVDLHMSRGVQALRKLLPNLLDE